MSTARIFIRQGSTSYRFMRFETSLDGSLIILLDRDPRPKRGAMSGSLDLSSNEPAILELEETTSDRPVPSFRFSVHTSGVVHRYADNERKGTIQIEPLYALTNLSGIAIVSIPRVSRLDLLDESKDRYDVAAWLEVPEGISERITFVIELGPKPQQPQSFGVGLNYELYSAVVRVVPNLSLSPELSEHFVTAMADSGVQSRVDKASAELNFYQRIHGPGPMIFREDKGGAYVALAAVPMAKPPKLSVAFSRPDLRIEVIPFERGNEPPHKVRFWICDKGGRNRREDLRKYITSTAWDSRL